jgi:hypothetical protein
MERPRYSKLHECSVANLFACRWGFIGGLKKIRLKSLGERYCNILDVWANEDVYLAEMARFRLSALSGIKQPKKKDSSIVLIWGALVSSLSWLRLPGLSFPTNALVRAMRTAWADKLTH